MIAEVRNRIRKEPESNEYVFNENDIISAPILGWLLGKKIVCPICGCDRDGQYGLTRIARASETDAWFCCQNCDSKIRYHKNPSGSILALVERRD